MKITMEFARQDDCLDKMVPSDLRLLVGERDDLERRNAELLKFQDRTLRGQCVCSSDGTDREHYPGCRLRDVARIAELERRNVELEKALEHIYELGRNGAGLQCSMYAQEALTRNKEQK